MKDFSFNEDDLRIEDQEEVPINEAEQATSTVLPDVEMEGMLKIKYPLEINGVYKGELQSNSRILVQEKGNIEGTINAYNVVIEGKSKVKMVARKRLEIQKNGEFIGTLEIQPEVIVFSENAKFGSNKEVAESFFQKYSKKKSS